MTLKDQPSKAPTRKIWAVIASGVIVGGITGGLEAAFPGADFTQLVEQFRTEITVGLMVVAGYFTRDLA